MEKEKVTLYEIKKDLTRCIFQEVKGISIEVPLLWFVFAIGIIIINQVIAINRAINQLLFGVMTGIILLIVTVCFVYIFILHTKIKKEEFKIRKDVLTEKRDYKPGGTMWHAYRPYRLTFCHGRFDIPAQLNYKWSSIYSMSEKEIYDASSIGDSFTLIEINRHILVVYNDKHFDVSSES